jgi:hypothetical protein
VRIALAIVVAIVGCDRAPSSAPSPSPSAAPVKLRDRPPALTRVTLKALGVT